MAELSSIVNVSISADSRAVTRAGFGTPLVLTYHTRFVERYRIYTSLSGMVSDGFVTTDDAYRMAGAVFAQNPRTSRVIVGRLPAAPTFVTQVTVGTAVAGQIIRLKVLALAAGTVVDPVTAGGVISPLGAVAAGAVVSITYTVQAAATLTSVATALELLVENVPGVDSTSSVAVISATPTTAGRKVHVYDVENCTIEETTGAAGYDTELAALQLVNDEWYFVTADSASQANINAIAGWVLANGPKMYFVGTSSQGELDGTGTIGFSLKAATNTRTVVLWAPNSHEFAGAAYAGMGAAKDPGSITWAFKSLAGVTAKTLTTTQKANLETDNVNHYQPVAGKNITRPGKVASGEWIDIIHGVDALTADVQESVFSLLSSSDKVPFTDAGLEQIATYALSACQRFEGSKNNPSLISIGTSYVTMPELTALAPADISARQLKGVKFGGVLAGAIHYVALEGTLTNT